MYEFADTLQDLKTQKKAAQQEAYLLVMQAHSHLKENNPTHELLGYIEIPQGTQTVRNRLQTVISWSKNYGAPDSAQGFLRYAADLYRALGRRLTSEEQNLFVAWKTLDDKILAAQNAPQPVLSAAIKAS